MSETTHGQSAASPCVGFAMWGLLELMGHRQRAGFIQEVEIAGTKMLRITLPAEGGDVEEFYGGASVYALRPMEEDVVRDWWRDRADPRPVRAVGYRAEPERAALSGYVDDDDDDLIPY